VRRFFRDPGWVLEFSARTGFLSHQAVDRRLLAWFSPFAAIFSFGVNQWQEMSVFKVFGFSGDHCSIFCNDELKPFKYLELPSVRRY
jgi:hypothetical protein